ncbi:MAG: hypothetical protein HFJ03_06800 [Lachnospira sp.]|jgi:ABC-type transport system involved in multi-copper enzyme maturation permease subunit|nr:hypothetical protein [Lachnospira sp.]
MIIVIIFLLLIFSNTGSQEYTSKINLVLYSSPISKRKIFINKMALIIIIAVVGISTIGGYLLLSKAKKVGCEYLLDIKQLIYNC